MSSMRAILEILYESSKLTVMKVIIKKLTVSFEKVLLTNIIWNGIFLVILFFNSLMMSFKLLLLYYLINNFLMLYGIIKMHKQLNQLPNIISNAIPNIQNNINQYLNIIAALIMFEGLCILCEWNLDFIVYVLMILTTIYFVSLKYALMILSNIRTILRIQPRLRIYLILYVIENVITFGIYLYVQ